MGAGPMYRVAYRSLGLFLDFALSAGHASSSSAVPVFPSSRIVCRSRGSSHSAIELNIRPPRSFLRWKRTTVADENANEGGEFLSMEVTAVSGSPCEGVLRLYLNRCIWTGLRYSSGPEGANHVQPRAPPHSSAAPKARTILPRCCTRKRRMMPILAVASTGGVPSQAPNMDTTTNQRHSYE